MLGQQPGASDDEVSNARVIPSGFTSCERGSSGNKPSLNMHRTYTCRSRPLAELDATFFASVSTAWKACLRAPTWKPAAKVRYPRGGTSIYREVPDAYIDTSYVRDTVLFSEGFCVLERKAEIAELVCGWRINN